MKIRGLIDEDIVNYKKCSMYIAFPDCSFKCGKEVCQNLELASSPIIEITPEKICRRYVDNSLSEAVVLGGLEPFDSPFDLLDFINCLRYKYKNDDDIVIYTGYTEEELLQTGDLKLRVLYNNIRKYHDVIIKFGRYVAGQEPHFDEVLGVNLASDNQYGKRIS